VAVSLSETPQVEQVTYRLLLMAGDGSSGLPARLAQGT
jgi:hypothetical protein